MFASVLLANEAALSWTEEEKGGFHEAYVPAVRIPVVEHRPWQDRAIRLPIKTREQVLEFLRDKVKAGLYERSQSAYRSGYFAVQKKDGRIRIMHDLQPLNRITVRDAGVPPLVDEVTEALAGCHIYTGLDAFAGYDQVALHEGSRDLTTFESPLGTLRLRRLPQGWTNAMAAFQRIMSFIYADELVDKLHVYIDDVTVHGPRTQRLGPDGRPRMCAPGVRQFVYEHAKWLNSVLHKMACYGGTFSGGKIQLAVPEIEMVGFRCSAKGRAVTKRAVSKITNWPACTTVGEVRGFLGTVGPARSWIQNYGQMVRPLVNLTTVKCARDFEWSPEADDAMTKAKAAVMASGFIKPLDFTRMDSSPPIVAVDSSTIGCGVELAQIDEQGKRRPARYLSFYFNSVQQRYSQPKLELYGVYVALRALRLWIYGVWFILEVDCSSIKQMINAPHLPSAAESRWCWYIKLMDFELRHVSGIWHRVPDGLSRRPQAEGDTDSDTDPEEWLDTHCGAITEEANGPAVGPAPSQDVEAGPPPRLFRDDRYDPTSRWHSVGLLLDKRSWGDDLTDRERSKVRQLAASCTLAEGMVVRHRTGRAPAVVLASRREIERALRALHEEHGHRGRRALTLLAGDRLHWDNMTNSIAHWVKSCPDCQAREHQTHEDPRRPLSAPVLFGNVSFDTVRMLPNVATNPGSRTNAPERAIIIAREGLTGWLEAKAVVEPNSADARALLFENIICRMGLVTSVMVDGGSEFRGDFEACCLQYGITLIRTSSYNPAANGMVERGHSQVKEGLFKLCRTQGPDWVSLLPQIVWADRCTARRTTGHTPYYLLYGQNASLPIDSTYGTYLAGDWRLTMATEDLLATRARQLLRLPEDHELARRRVEEARHESILHHNAVREAHQRNRAYEVGDLVLVRNTAQDNSHRVRSEDRYRGPYRILTKSSQGAVTLGEVDGVATRDPIAVAVGHNRLKMFIRREDPRSVAREDTAAAEYRSRALPQRETPQPLVVINLSPNPRPTNARIVAANNTRDSSTF